MTDLLKRVGTAIFHALNSIVYWLLAFLFTDTTVIRKILSRNKEKHFGYLSLAGGNDWFYHGLLSWFYYTEPAIFVQFGIEVYRCVKCYVTPTHYSCFLSRVTFHGCKGARITFIFDCHGTNQL